MVIENKNAAPKLATTTRSLRDIFKEAGEKKLVFVGPDNLKQDSRYAVQEVANDFVVFKLLGDEVFVLPYASILSLKVAPLSLTIRYE